MDYETYSKWMTEKQNLKQKKPSTPVMPPAPIVAQNLTVVELDADDDTSQDAADLVSQESKDDKSKSGMKNNEQDHPPPPVAVEPIDAFVHVIGHPDRHGDTDQDSPKSPSLKENLDVIDKPLKPSHNEVGISYYQH